MIKTREFRSDSYKMLINHFNITGVEGEHTFEYKQESDLLSEENFDCLLQ